MNLVDVVVKNGKIVTPMGIVNAGVAINEGKIVNLSTDANLPRADRTIDAGGNYILPGVIDAHVHLKGYNKTEIIDETKSAAAGGVTTVFQHNQSTNFKRALTPSGKKFSTQEDLVSFKDVFEPCLKILNESTIVDHGFNFGILSDEQASEIPEYAAKFGVTSFKFWGTYGQQHKSYLGYGKAENWLPMIGFPPPGFDDGTIFLAFEKIGQIGPPGIAIIHCENPGILRVFKDRLIKQGRKDPAAWSDRSPPFVEAEQIRRYTYLAKHANCPLYIVHLSTGESLNEVAKAKYEGAKIFAEVTPHHLVLTKHDDPPGVLGKVNPPLRDKENIERLWQGLRSGVIDCIGTDHVPSKRAWKEVKDDIWQTGSGFPGLATLLPIMLSEGVNKGRITFERLVEVCCQNPAKAMGIYPKKGALGVGSDGDIVIVDMNKTVKVTPEIMHSGSDIAVFEGRELKGWPILTMIRGNTVMEQGEITGKPGDGQYVRRILGHQLYPIES